MKQSEKDKQHAAREQALVDDLKTQIDAATKEQANKLAASKEHMLGQLTVVSEKHLTVNGYMQARQTIKEALFGESYGQAESLARSLAGDISELAVQLHDKIAALDVMDIDAKVLDDLYDKEFISKPHGLEDVAYQLLVMHLLQNLGPLVDELVQWREGTNAGLATLNEELAKLEPAKQLKAVTGGKK